MPPSRPKKQTSVQTYHWGKGLTVRLEYDRLGERQSVFHNNLLVSSFLCPVGMSATHKFRSVDAISRNDEDGYLGDYVIRFAVEPDTFRIRFDISRRNAGGTDVKLYWYDRNMKPDEWGRFPSVDSDLPSPFYFCSDCDNLLICPSCKDVDKCCDCEESLICSKCDQENEERCRECGCLLTCPDCYKKCQEEAAEFNSDIILDQLCKIDPEQLRELLINMAGSFHDSDMPWPVMLDKLLDKAG